LRTQERLRAMIPLYHCFFYAPASKIISTQLVTLYQNLEADIFINLSARQFRYMLPFASFYCHRFTTMPK